MFQELPIEPDSTQYREKMMSEVTDHRLPEQVWQA
jgi:hypothetical protein